MIIAVIDQGVQWDHPDLLDNIWQNLGEDGDGDGHTIEWSGSALVFDPGDINGTDDDGNGKADDFIGWDFTGSEDNNPEPANANEFHGTAVSSIAGAATWNGQFMVGISGGWFDDPLNPLYGCSIMPLRVLEDPPSNNELTHTVNAINYAVLNGASVINFSFGWFNLPPPPQSLNILYETIQLAYINSNCLFVAAAGNSNNNLFVHPASYDEVIAVAGTNSSDTRWDGGSYGSNFGEWIEVSAPASGIVSLKPYNSSASYSGTSLASPYVAGLAGLIFSNNPGIDKKVVRSIIKITAEDIDNLNPGFEGLLGKGRINAYQALNYTSSINIVDFTKAEIVGDGDGEFQPGESGSITVKLINTFSAMAQNVVATLSTSVNGIQITTAQSSYGDIQPAVEKLPGTPFQIQLDVNIMPEQEIVFQIDVQTANLGNFQDSFTLRIKYLNQQNWPGGDFEKYWGGPIIVDLDPAQNNGEEIIVTSTDELEVYRADGTLYWSNYYGNYIVGTPAIGNIDNNEDIEIILTTTTAPPNFGAQVHCLHTDGTSYGSPWPRNLTQYCWNSPTLADLDNDQNDEIIVVSHVDNLLYIWNEDNKPVTGWEANPIQLNAGQNAYRNSCAVGDLDQNGKLEIVVGTDLLLYKFSSPTSSITRSANFYGKNPIIADVNNDGLLEYFSLHPDQKTILIFDQNGTALYSRTMPESIGRFSVGNINDDDFLEVLVMLEDQTIHALDYQLQDIPDPEENWPLNIFFSYPYYNNEITIADINGDGLGDIILGSDYGFLYAFDHTGSSINGFPIITHSIQTTCTVKDLDGDGDAEILSAASFAAKGIEIFDCPNEFGVPFDNLSNNWKSYDHDVKNSGLFAQTYNSSYSPDPGLTNIVWNFGPETPVVIWETVTIPLDKSLTISPGSRILFKPGAKLMIRGTLIAEGTESDSICFASFSNNPNERGIGLSVSKYTSSQSSHLAYCSFKGLSTALEIGIQFGAPVQVENSLIKNSIKGISISYSSPLIEHCTISSNSVGVEINVASPQLIANAITSNNDYGIFYINSSGEVTGNSITDFQLITFNSINDGPGGGIYCVNGSAPVFEKIDALEWKGYNQIVNNNHYGLKVETESSVILGERFGYNSVHSNTEFQVRCYDNSEVVAQQIWWGTPEPTDKLFDTDETSGIDYSNYLTSDPFAPGNKLLTNPGRSEHTPLFFVGKKYINLHSLNTHSEKQLTKYYLSQNGKIEASGFEGKAISQTQLPENLLNKENENLKKRLRELYRKKDWLQLKLLAAKSFNNISINKEVIKKAITYLSNAYIQQSDSNFVTFLQGFALLQNDSTISKQINNFHPLHLLKFDKIDQAFSICQQNLNNYPDTLSQKLNSFIKFRITLINRNKLAQARQMLNQMQQRYPNAPLTRMAEIDLAAYEGKTPRKLSKSSTIAPNLTLTNIPKIYRLGQNYPNPFNPETNIKYELPKPSKVKLEIFNILGQRVKTLVNLQQSPGYYTVQWNSSNESGNRVSSGLYINRLTATAVDRSESFVKVKKMLLIK